MVAAERRTSSSSSLLSSSPTRIANSAAQLVGVVLAVVFGAYTVLSYRASIQALREASEANKLTLLTFCESNNYAGPACRRVLASFSPEDAAAEVFGNEDEDELKELKELKAQVRPSTTVATAVVVVVTGKPDNVTRDEPDAPDKHKENVILRPGQEGAAGEPVADELAADPSRYSTHRKWGTIKQGGSVKDSMDDHDNMDLYVTTFEGEAEELLLAGAACQQLPSPCSDDPQNTNISDQTSHPDLRLDGSGYRIGIAEPLELSSGDEVTRFWRSLLSTIEMAPMRLLSLWLQRLLCLLWSEK